MIGVIGMWKVAMRETGTAELMELESRQSVTGDRSAGALNGDAMVN